MEPAITAPASRPPLKANLQGLQSPLSGARWMGVNCSFGCQMRVEEAVVLCRANGPWLCWPQLSKHATHRQAALDSPADAEDAPREQVLGACCKAQYSATCERHGWGELQRRHLLGVVGRGGRGVNAQRQCCKRSAAAGAPTACRATPTTAHTTPTCMSLPAPQTHWCCPLGFNSAVCRVLFSRGVFYRDDLPLLGTFEQRHKGCRMMRCMI